MPKAKAETKLDVVEESKAVDIYADESDITKNMPPDSAFKDSGLDLPSTSTKEETPETVVEDAVTPKTDETPEEEPSTSESEEEESLEDKEPDSEESGDTGEDETGATGDKSTEDPKGVQKRINELTFKRRAAEREAERFKRENEELRKATQKTETSDTKAATETDDTKPNQADYEEYDEYVEALTAWRVGQELRKEADRRKQEDQQTVEKERQKAVQDKLNKGSKAYKDFEEVALNENMPFSDSMGQVIFDSDNTADILYYLGQHADEADRISQLPLLATAREIGKIEALITQTPAIKTDNKTSTIQKKLSSIHQESKPVKTGGTIKRDLETLSMPEFEKEMKNRRKEEW